MAKLQPNALLAVCQSFAQQLLMMKILLQSVCAGLKCEKYGLLSLYLDWTLLLLKHCSSQLQDALDVHIFIASGIAV